MRLSRLISHKPDQEKIIFDRFTGHWNASHSSVLLKHIFHHGYHRCCSSQATGQTDLVRHLQARIRSGSPLTVAEYMKEVLTNPLGGYYMKRDVFGSKGDFITSPEISQMFGELLGVWCLNEWLQSGSPPHMQLVELGPGRGTLTEDILRVFSQFAEIKDKVSVHLVEVSPKLAELQRQRLCGAHSDSKTDESAGPVLSKYGPKVHWHSHLIEVPQAFSCYLAHEFFDALPVHKFQKTDRGWCEVLVDVDDGPEKNEQSKFRFVLSPGPTVASTSLFTTLDNDPRDHIEQSPEGGVIIQEIASRISQHGGAALIADYGHSGDKTDTLRGFKDHQLHDVLTEPGSADLTADVDFLYLKHMAGKSVSTHGPLSQEKFLHHMGIRLRLQVLLQKADVKTQKDLLSGYAMLTDPAQMGERFKFFALTSYREGEYQPAGFSPPC